MSQNYGVFANRLQGETIKSVKARPILIHNFLNSTQKILHVENKEEIKQNKISNVSEAIVEIKKFCKQCKEATKARLQCGHTLCEDCLHTSAYSHFIINEPYKHSATCFDCKEEVPIGTFIDN